MSNRFTNAAVAFTLAAMSVGGVGAGGCSQQTTVLGEPDVEWMLPDAGGDAGALGASDTIDVYATPGLGASDALGLEIFAKHDERRFAEARMVRLMAVADSTPTGRTLWLDTLGVDDATIDLFAGAPVRYAASKPDATGQPQTITSVDTDSIGKD